MAAMVSMSPTMASALSRQASASSDDSSMYELSFDYSTGEDGKVVRVSKKRQPSLPSTTSTPAIHYELPLDTDIPPSPVSVNAPSNNGAGLQVPRRSSLSKSESAPSPNEWEHNREWKRTISTPAAYS